MSPGQYLHKGVFKTLVQWRFHSVLMSLMRFRDTVPVPVPCPDGSWVGATCTAFLTSRADCDPWTALLGYFPSSPWLPGTELLEQGTEESRDASFLPSQGRATATDRACPGCTHQRLEWSISGLRHCGSRCPNRVSGGLLEWVFLHFLCALRTISRDFKWVFLL